MGTQITVQVNQAGPSASEGLSRMHRIRMDRPESKGGENRGPMGGEVLLMSLGGCFMSNLLAAAAARNVAVTKVQLVISGMLENSPPRYSAVGVFVSADYADRDVMEKLLTIAERSCIVANTLKQAVDLTIQLK